jgi:hypothetical protein
LSGFYDATRRIGLPAAIFRVEQSPYAVYQLNELRCITHAATAQDK